MLYEYILRALALELAVFRLRHHTSTSALCVLVLLVLMLNVARRGAQVEVCGRAAELYSVRGLCMRTQKRREHLSTEIIKRNKQLLQALKTRGPAASEIAELRKEARSHSHSTSRLPVPFSLLCLASLSLSLSHTHTHTHTFARTLFAIIVRVLL